ncbi:MAG TPA: SBBP repeat-containing protein [Candidatus Bipolaricaulota bacterium]|nr:SBBP repeat-containing protein [Candidatus Bipolaricaulota bacterium]
MLKISQSLFFIRRFCLTGLTVLISVLMIFNVVNAGAIMLQLTSATPDSAVKIGEEKLLQFTSEGHVVGFDKDGLIVASARHMLKVDFLNSNAVSPEADDGVLAENNIDQALPLNRVTYTNVWDGITVAYEANEQSIVKSTYYIDATKEGIPVDRIRLGYNRPVQIDENGNLVVVYEDGTIIEGAPIAWQDVDGHRESVIVNYTLYGEREVGFSLGDYIPGIPVIIDPDMTWNTFLGTTGSDVGRNIVVDGSGNVYVDGYSNATWGAPVRDYTLGRDVFVVKFNSSGNLIWNTFLGGSGLDSAGGIAIDDSGNFYVSGYSNATWGAPARDHTSGYDVFTVKLDSGGNLIWNTFLGGSGTDYAYDGIVVDGSGNVYVAGTSDVTWGSPVRDYTLGADGFAAKLGSSGNLIWNTFLGDSGVDSIYGIVLDDSGNIYVGGYGEATWGSPVRAYTLGYDSFVVKLDSSGNLIWNTFLGGSGLDACRGIGIDDGGNVYIIGYSDVSWGAPVRAYTLGYDIFAVKLDSGGNLIWNTFLGGSGGDRGYGIAVDGSGNVYVTGYSDVTWGSPVRAYTLDRDAFAFKLNSGGDLIWNTFLGGGASDTGWGIAVDSDRNVYVSGYGDATWGSPARAYTSGSDGFAVKLSNVVPVASDVSITGTPNVRELLTG